MQSGISSVADSICGSWEVDSSSTTLLVAAHITLSGSCNVLSDNGISGASKASVGKKSTIQVSMDVVSCVTGSRVIESDFHVLSAGRTQNLL